MATSLTLEAGFSLIPSPNPSTEGERDARLGVRPAADGGDKTAELKK